MLGIRVLTLLLMGTGCTWISQADIDARRSDVDDDGDGYVAADDCDDDDATINPAVAETWYDGIDADCAGDDDYDADADGYVPSAYLTLTTAGVEGSGLLPGGDCDDALRTVNPAAVDTWYDGQDTDCGGEDDYDVDVDSYVPDDYAGLATSYVEGSGALPGGDCDDDDATINPAVAETWYDGIDADCAGDDDYDADADGYVRDEHEGLATEGIATSGRLPPGDCDDNDATRSPGIAETWYDGIDDDCAEDNDYDADADGYVRDADATLAELPGGDCDDDDSEINPGADENLSDGRDLDCDGDSASFAISQLADYSGWLSPHSPRFDENISAVFFSVATDEVSDGTNTYYDSAIAFSLDGSDPSAGPTEQYIWQKHVVDPTSYQMTGGHDFAVTNEYLFGVTGLLFSSHRTMRLGGFDLQSGSTNGLPGHLFNTSDPVAEFTDLSMVLDSDGSIYAVGCDATDGLLQYISASLATAVDSDVDIEASVEGVVASTCELHIYDAPDGTLLTGQSTGLVTDSFDLTSSAPTLTSVSLNSAYSPLAIEVPADGNSALAVVADPDALYVFEDDDAILWTASLVTPPASVHAVYAPSGQMVIAMADDAGDVRIYIGDPDTGVMDEHSVTLDFAATEVAVWVESSSTYIIVGAIGESEVAIGAAEL